MATNSSFAPEHQLRRGQASVLAEIGEDDLLAAHLAEALTQTEDSTTRYHLREALQLRLAEQH